MLAEPADAVLVIHLALASDLQGSKVYAKVGSRSRGAKREVTVGKRLERWGAEGMIRDPAGEERSTEESLLELRFASDARGLAARVGPSEERRLDAGGRAESRVLHL